MRFGSAKDARPKRVTAFVRQLGSELLVIDTQTNKAHCLNEMSGQIWNLCDGKKSVADIQRHLSHDTGTEVPETVVWLALRQLRKAKLLISPAQPPREEPRSRSRRELMQKMGVASALALPAVASIVMPTPAEAVSCLHNGRPCVTNSQCCSGHCNSMKVCSA